MSINGNDNQSGSPDVEEPNSSNLSTARQKGRRGSSNHLPASHQRSLPNSPVSSSSRGRRRGKASGRMRNKNRSKLIEDAQPAQLMTTNSAPLDERTDVYKLDGDGINTDMGHLRDRTSIQEGNSESQDKHTVNAQSMTCTVPVSSGGPYPPEVTEEGTQGTSCPEDHRSSSSNSDKKQTVYEKKQSPKVLMLRTPLAEHVPFVHAVSSLQHPYFASPGHRNMHVTSSHHCAGGGVVMNSRDPRMTIPHPSGMTTRPVPLMQPQFPYRFSHQVIQQPTISVNSVPVQHSHHSFEQQAAMYSMHQPGYAQNFHPSCIPGAPMISRSSVIMGMPGDPMSGPHRNMMPITDNRFMGQTLLGFTGILSYRQQHVPQPQYVNAGQPMSSEMISHLQPPYIYQHKASDRPLRQHYGVNYSQQMSLPLQSLQHSTGPPKKKPSLRDKSGNVISLEDLRGNSSPRGSGSMISSPITLASDMGRSPSVHTPDSLPSAKTLASLLGVTLVHPVVAQVRAPDSELHLVQSDITAPSVSTASTSVDHFSYTGTMPNSNEGSKDISESTRSDHLTDTAVGEKASTVEMGSTQIEGASDTYGPSNTTSEVPPLIGSQLVNPTQDIMAQDFFATNAGADSAECSPIIDFTASNCDALLTPSICQSTVLQVSCKNDNTSESKVESVAARKSTPASTSGQASECATSISVATNTEVPIAKVEDAMDESTWENESSADIRARVIENNRNLFFCKDKLVVADSKSGAYTSESTSVINPVEVISVTDSVPSRPVPYSKPTDNWEVQAETNKRKPAIRSLRPQGKKLNAGSRPVTTAPMYIYCKAELLKLKIPKEQMECPRLCMSYGSIVAIWKTSNPQYLQQGGPNKRWKQGGHSHHQQYSNVPLEDKQVSGWNRGQQQTLPPQQQRRNPRRGPTPPMPKKVITDPLEVMSREVFSILNKITPHTLLKLTSQIADISIISSTMLDQLTQLVFDKAVNEPNFASLYAEMCYILNTRSTFTDFCHVVWNKDSNQYLWIRDMEYSNCLSGPYSSVEECVDATLGINCPPTQPIKCPVSVIDITIVRGILISVFKTTDRDDFFVTFIPFADFDDAKKSGTCFPTREAALKSISLRHGFQKKLVRICQNEYIDAVSNTGYYSSPSKRWKKLSREKANMTADEVAMEQLEIEELEGAVKRRMFGNIHFIGELYKKGMIRHVHIHDCIDELLFGKSVGDQELELVCRLLRTVGYCMENVYMAQEESLQKQKKWEEQEKVFNSYFVKLSELATEERISPRIRFSIEEIISLRNNNWKERRETDSPALVGEIRMKVVSKGQMKRQQYNRGRDREGTQSLQDSRMGGAGRGGVRYQADDVHKSSAESVYSVGRDTPHQPRYDSSSGGPQKNPVEKLSYDVLKRKTSTIVDEYLSLRDLKETNDCMEELPPNACGEVVLRVIEKYLNCNKSDKQSEMIQFLNRIMPRLRVAQMHVEASLRKCEDLLLLVDVVVDVIKAPEWLGNVISVLIQGSACRREVIDEVLVQVRAENQNDAFGIPDHELVAIHQRFLSSLS